MDPAEVVVVVIVTIIPSITITTTLQLTQIATNLS